MFVQKDFVCHRLVVQIGTRQNVHAPEFTNIRATKRRRAKSFATNIGTVLRNMPTNFEPKQSKLKLDIVKKPENRVRENSEYRPAV